MSTVGGLTGAEPSRPGAAYYVPGLRIRRATAGAASSWMELPKDVLYDVLRAEVTRVNTGVCTYTITLNNAYLSTPADRDEPGRYAHGQEAFARERVAGANPFWPRFKYNDFSYLRLGERLRLEMRYWPDPSAGSTGSASSPQIWVPMIAGPITDMRFGFATGQGAQLTISGEDDLGVLKDKNEKRLTLNRLAELEIVRRILQRAKEQAKEQLVLTDVAEPPLVPRPRFVEIDRQGVQESLQEGQSYLDALQKLADRLDFEVFVEFSQPLGEGSRPELHFEPYRGRVPKDGNGREAFLLEREKNLIEFNPTIKVVDQYTSVEVRGRHRDPQRAEEVNATVMGTILADELRRSPEDGPLVPGSAVREHFFGGRPNKFSVPHVSNLDAERAELYAQAVIRKKARELFTIEGATVGLPRLRPGTHVEIRGMRPPFDGFYYVTKTTHAFGADGFRTRFTASRPGMELPGAGGYAERAPRRGGT